MPRYQGAWTNALQAFHVGNFEGHMHLFSVPVLLTLGISIDVCLLLQGVLVHRAH